jgi:pimeloyl-ACP methyl ester carboxylesterase
MEGQYPKLIVFSQHGMSDGNYSMETLAKKVAPPESKIIAPYLGSLPSFVPDRFRFSIETHFAIAPLIQKVAKSAEQAFQDYPDIPARIIATSLGGVIWVEVLSRHPEWCSRIESLVLLGSPIGGADAAKILSDWGFRIGMAKHLSEDRRYLAEKIAAVIPTLVVAGHIIGGWDLMVTVESTKIKHAHFVCLNGVNHSDLRTHPRVVQTIQEFWANPRNPLQI